MDQKTIYRTVFGVPMFGTPVVTTRALPSLRVNGFRLVETPKLKYWYYRFNGVNIHVYGPDEVIRHLAETGQKAHFEFNIEEKTGPKSRIYHLNLTVVDARTPATHEVAIVGRSYEESFMFFFGTDDMRGVGIGIRRV